MDSFIEPGIYRHPRLRKSILPSSAKKGKVIHKIEQISFDHASREEYLTGFHKRKVARIKAAQAETEKKSREEKRALRKKLKQEQKKNLEEHIEVINAALRNLDDFSGVSGEDTEVWNGFYDGDDDLPPNSNSINYEEDFVDGGKSTTVTVESISITKNGLIKCVDLRQNSRSKNIPMVENPKVEKIEWTVKPKRKKFRYENKTERKLVIKRQKSVKKKQSVARKSKSSK